METEQIEIEEKGQPRKAIPAETAQAAPLT
jgi:hypothetical protein